MESCNSSLNWEGTNPAEYLLISEQPMFGVRLLSTYAANPLRANQCREEEEGGLEVKREKIWSAARVDV